MLSSSSISQDCSAKHDWVGRASARDDALKMVAREAVEEHERKQGADLARRASRCKKQS